LKNERVELGFDIHKGRVSTSKDFEMIIHEKALFKVIGDNEDAFRDILGDEILELTELLFVVEIGAKETLIMIFFVEVEEETE